MDIKQSLEYKTKSFDKYTVIDNNKYDYQTNGILRKCLPKILFKGNSILVSFLQLIDMRLIMILNYVKKLKEFKYISWYR